jgi:hypothetical protein
VIFRADAAFAKPEIYAALEERDMKVDDSMAKVSQKIDREGAGSRLGFQNGRTGGSPEDPGQRRCKTTQSLAVQGQMALCGS